MNLSEKQQELNELKEKLEAYRSKYLPADVEEAIEVPPPPFIACCPKCGGEVEVGHVEIHGTFWGFVFVGFSYQHCWFVPAGRTEEIVLRTEEKQEACRCTKCGTLVIAGGKAQRR
jgi:hypothetical protein